MQSIKPRTSSIKGKLLLSLDPGTNKVGVAVWRLGDTIELIKATTLELPPEQRWDRRIRKIPQKLTTFLSTLQIQPSEIDFFVFEFYRSMNNLLPLVSGTVINILESSLANADSFVSPSAWKALAKHFGSKCRGSQEIKGWEAFLGMVEDDLWKKMKDLNGNSPDTADAILIGLSWWVKTSLGVQKPDTLTWLQDGCTFSVSKVQLSPVSKTKGLRSRKKTDLNGETPQVVFSVKYKKKS